MALSDRGGDDVEDVREVSPGLLLHGDGCNQDVYVLRWYTLRQPL